MEGSQTGAAVKADWNAGSIRLAEAWQGIV
jgi:hypothetical protein